MTIRDEDDLIDIADANLLRDKVRAALAALPDQYRQVLTMRFGLETGQCRTLAEIADELNLDGPQEARSIEAAALARLVAMR